MMREAALSLAVSNDCARPLANPRQTTAIAFPSSPLQTEDDAPWPAGPAPGAGGAPAQCRALAEKTLGKEKECTLAPCAFNGVHQPSLSRTFAREDVYLFSYFYDRTQPLGTSACTFRIVHTGCGNPEKLHGKV